MNPENLITEMLIAIGENPEREGLKETPMRVVKSWRELYGGYSQDPKSILSTCFKEGACDEMVILKDIEFISTCEHHMLPFRGAAHVGYVPDDRVVGLSKLARLVDCFARRLQIQEKMTQEIAGTIFEVLKPKGVGVIVEAHHSCMSCRGVMKKNPTMITSSMLGCFRTESSARTEFLTLVSKG